MCYALAVNWVPEKRSRSEQLRDIGDVNELKIDNNDNEGNAEVRSLDRMRGQTESDRRSLSTVSNKTVPITNPNTVREAHCNHTWEFRLALV